MASITYHRNKKTGAIYVYSVHSYWDKEKKRPSNKQVCLGRLDEATGEIIPSQRKRKIAERAAAAPGITAQTLVVGPDFLLERLADLNGLKPLLRKCFPEQCDAILSLVYFVVQKGLPLAHCETWSAGHLHPFGEVMSSQRVSELLLQLKEDERQHFLSLWLTKQLEDDYLCYDITSVSSYAEGNEYLRRGYNRDGEALPQINLAMLFGQKHRLPAYYRRMPGNITDVATLKTTVKSLDFLGVEKLHLVLDRGFYSESNIDELFRMRHHFTLATPAGRKWVEKIIDEYYEGIASPENYLELDDEEALYVKTKLHYWGDSGRRCYLHVYYNAHQAAAEFDRFTRELLKYKEELVSGKQIKAHEEFYERYFTIKETPKRGLKVSFNDDAIQKNRKRYAGFFCIMSSKIKDPLQALNIYRGKDVVENCFDDLKNHLDMKRLRVHSSRAMDSRIFLQFLALIFISQIRNTIREDRILKNLTVRELMEEMETLVQIRYSNRYGQLITETTPIQRLIIAAFDVKLPT